MLKHSQCNLPFSGTFHISQSLDPASRPFSYKHGQLITDQWGERGCEQPPELNTGTPKLQYTSKAADCTDQTKTWFSSSQHQLRFPVTSVSYQEGSIPELAESTCDVTFFPPTYDAILLWVRGQEVSSCHPYRPWNVDLKVQVFILSVIFYR